MSRVDFSDPATIALLTAALEAAGVEGLQIDQPNRSLRIILGNGTRSTVSDVVPAKDGEGARSATLIKAPMAGQFLTHHPLRPDADQSYPRSIRQMDILGFLAVGPVLLPVKSTKAGIVTKSHVEHGAIVGFGAALYEIEPQP